MKMCEDPEYDNMSNPDLQASVDSFGNQNQGFSLEDENAVPTGYSETTRDNSAILVDNYHAVPKSHAKRLAFRSRKYAVAVDGSLDDGSHSSEIPHLHDEQYNYKDLTKESDTYVERRHTISRIPIHKSAIQIGESSGRNETEHNSSVQKSHEVQQIPRTDSTQHTITVDNSHRYIGRSCSAASANKRRFKFSFKGGSLDDAQKRILTLNVGDSAIGRLVRQLSGQAPYVVQAEPPVKQPRTFFDLSLFSMCCCFSPFGLVAIVLSVMSDSNYKTGDVPKAKKYGTIAMALSITGMITSVAIAIALLLTLAYPDTDTSD